MRSNTDNVTVVISTDAVSMQSRCMSSEIIINAAKNAVFHLTDFFRVAFVSQALIGRYLEQLFTELEHYNYSPSEEAQKTWMNPMLISIALGLSAIVKIINAWQLKKNPHEHFDAEGKFLLPIFSSAWFFILLDVFSPSGNVGSLSLYGFVAASAICIPILIALFAKLSHTDSNNDIIFSVEKLASLNLPRYPSASKLERHLNRFTGAKYGVEAVATFLETVTRQVNQRSVELAPWKKALVGLAAIPSMQIGFHLTDHPNAFHFFTAGANALAYGSLSYDALSAYCFTFITYFVCSDYHLCVSDNTREYLTYFCFAVALGFGLFSAATTRFRVEEHHGSQERFIAGIYNFPDNAKDACTSLARWCQEKGAFMSSQVKKCCAKEEVSPEMASLVV